MLTSREQHRISAKQRERPFISCWVEEVEILVCYNGSTPAPVGDIPDKPLDHNFPKREFGQTSKYTDLFQVPGLADGNGCTVYDATSDLAF